MTIIVGVRCSDGVVIGADSMATSAMGVSPIINIPHDGKIRIFASNVIVATTGSVGYAQRLHEHISAAIYGNVFQNFNVRDCTNNIAKRFITELGNSLAPRHQDGTGVRFGALLAAPLKDGPFLAEFGTTDFQPEIKDKKLFFVSMGSGQILADPFLAFVSRVLWKNEMPTVDDAKLGVYWVLNHTIQLAPGQVGPPIKLATLSKVDNKWQAIENDTQEVSQYIVELENHIGKFSRVTVDEATPSTPPPIPK